LILIHQLFSKTNLLQLIKHHLLFPESFPLSLYASMAPMRKGITLFSRLFPPQGGYVYFRFSFSEALPILLYTLSFDLPKAPNIRKLDTEFFVTQSSSKSRQLSGYGKFHKEIPHLTWCNFLF